MGTFRAGKGGTITGWDGQVTQLLPGKTYTDYDLPITRTYAPTDILDTFTQIGKVVAAAVPGGAIAVGLADAGLQLSKGDNMNIGGLLGGIGQAIGGITNPIAQVVGNLASTAGTIYSAVTQPQTPVQAFVPQTLAAPVYSPMPQPAMLPAATPVMSAAPVIAAGAGMITRLTAPILGKIAAKLGRRGVSLQAVIGQVRKMAKFAMGPEAIAFSLGITSAELASLITAHTSRRSRRMNPANGRALRRAIRRVKSFHKLCVHTDVIKPRRRSCK